MKTESWIELPCDEYGNRWYTRPDPIIIRGEISPGTGKPGTWGSVDTMHVSEPAEFKERYGNIVKMNMAGGEWRTVDEPPGVITEERYREIVLGLDDLQGGVVAAVFALAAALAQDVTSPEGLPAAIRSKGDSDG